MKKILYFLSFISFFAFGQQKEEDSPQGRAEFEYRRIAPPDGSKIPFGELNRANQQIDAYFRNRPKTAIPNIAWQERGPSNIGGRVRAIMFDPNTTNKIWAGSVAGGLWYNSNVSNINTNWTKVDDFWENLAITSIAYDPTNTQRFYVGTGEGFGNLDQVLGGGMWRTEDGGATWNRLPNTVPNHDNTDTDVKAVFRSVQKVIVNSSGRIFVGGNHGVAYSDDNGDNWLMVSNLPSGFFVDDMEISSIGTLYVVMRQWGGNNNPWLRRIYRSTNAAYSAWSLITPIDNSIWGVRTEIALAPSTSGNSQVIYAICQNDTTNNSNGVLWFKKSSDNGANWSNITIPSFTGNVNDHFTRNQAWYDLILAVHPTNSSLVIAGGVILARTTNGGTSWHVYDSFPVHADEHGLKFDPNDANNVLISNDGGVYYSTNFGNSSTASASVTFEDRNRNLRITQPYHVAMKNIAGDNYLIGGTQDNGTIRTDHPYVGTGNEVLGSDGWRCFIDNNEPNIRILSTQYISHYFYDGTNTPVQFINGGTAAFYNPCDYDDINNTFFAFRDSSQQAGNIYTRFYRVTGMGGTRTVNTFKINIAIPVSFIKVGRAANTIIVGCGDGRIYRISSVNLATATATILRNASNTYISCIDVGVDDNEILAIFSNYNTSSVRYTNTGGTTWIDKDAATHGLPNIPVRYGLFNPTNRNQVLIATESGVWSTMNITGANPGWEPTDQLLAHVRCDMLFYRSADNMIAVATHGRGAFTAILNTCPSDLSLFVDSNGSKHYEVSNAITSQAELQLNKKVRYDAGYKVRLTNGFKVKAGTHFKAYIDGCGGIR
ncbi:WD40/YVTN/BNR-like repeat-containing protein [Emticicia sp.]|uniref:WD40/YVTN/BNR-like repeat-containing protein n=1 Tax=Emticicia sp. TaxID=1930953 RepID=UPI003752D4DF